MRIQVDKLYKARSYYYIGMVLMVIAGYALVTCGSLLFKLAESFPVMPLAVAALLLVLYNLLAVTLYVRFVRTQQSALVRFYLTNKVIRMFFAFAIVGGYIVLAKTDIVAFAISFFILYILTVVYESVFFVQIEKQINEN